MESEQRDSVNGVKGIPLGWSRDASPGRGLLNTQGNPDRHSVTAYQRISTWNVRTLYQDGKLENVLQEMRRLKVDILAMS